MPFSESIKTAVRQKAHFLCCICKTFGVEIHHIVPEEQNGPDTEDNAAPLCPTCHEIYGANPTKRKLIREARDHWYATCEKRFSFDGGLFQEVHNLLKDKASKSDIEDLKVLVRDSRLATSTAITSAGRTDVTRLGIDELVVYLMNTKSSGREVQSKMLLLSGFWPPRRGLRKIRSDFIKNFGLYTALKAAALALSEMDVPTRDFMTEDEISRSLHHLAIILACYNLAFDGEIFGALTSDGQLVWYSDKDKKESRSASMRKKKRPERA